MFYNCQQMNPTYYHNQIYPSYENTIRYYQDDYQQNPTIHSYYNIDKASSSYENYNPPVNFNANWTSRTNKPTSDFSDKFPTNPPMERDLFYQDNFENPLRSHLFTPEQKFNSSVANFHSKLSDSYQNKDTDIYANKKNFYNDNNYFRSERFSISSTESSVNSADSLFLPDSGFSDSELESELKDVKSLENTQYPATIELRSTFDVFLPPELSAKVFCPPSSLNPNVHQRMPRKSHGTLSSKRIHSCNVPG